MYILLIISHPCITCVLFYISIHIHTMLFLKYLHILNVQLYTNIGHVTRPLTHNLKLVIKNIYSIIYFIFYSYIEKAKTVYLIFYNLFQFIGYLYILMVIGIRYYNAGTASIPLTYAAVGNAMKLCQLLQYLESMHPLFNYTKGSVLMPFLQVTGRNFVLFIMIENEEHMQTKPVIFYLFIVWSIIEIVR